MNGLRDSLQEYLSLRRALGFKLRKEGRLLPVFLDFMEHESRTFITTELAVRWATAPNQVTQAYHASRLRMVRLFAKYRLATDPQTEMPPQGLLPFRYHRKQPYLYSETEILHLLAAARQLNSPTGLRAATYSTLFGLMVVTGMRISEPIALSLEDVDMKLGILTIRNSKFGKSRLIPVHHSTVEKLQEYEHLRKQIFPRTTSTRFFLSEQGTALTSCMVRWTFVGLLRRLSLRAPSDKHGPRVHDIRHAFAVRTLINWYREGEDVEQRLPELATYLGHRHVNDTYWYISAVPELLRLATERLEKCEGGLLT